jgi:tRNA C32,U32 (ribose-2'-O)-methylase TrmJ
MRTLNKYKMYCFPGLHGIDTFRSIRQLTDQLEKNGLLGPSACTEEKVAFVFGREVTGLTDEEVTSCSAVCSINMGRLQESLSLGHAVAIALCAAFERSSAFEENATLHQ